ncbi:Mammalian cell entry related domain protein [mine drainage metagenome]|uniref:Mammalian cell entry related domain protein n=1 Tax=mine drainage metagenome TaxID=410659 RepID=T1BC66_9ZZZZ
MRQSSVLEVTTGLFVVLGIAALFYLATKTTDYRTVSGGHSYVVRAYFNNVGGLHVGAPVQMGGGHGGAGRRDPLQHETLSGSGPDGA